MIAKILSQMLAGLRAFCPQSRSRWVFLWNPSPIVNSLHTVRRAILPIRWRLKKRRNPPLEQATLNISTESTPTTDPELARRREVAKLTNKRKHPKLRLLYDPINDDPACARAISEAGRRACAEVGHPHVLGICHLIWRRQKQILKEEFGIEWYFPREMNPRMMFD